MVHEGTGWGSSMFHYLTTVQRRHNSAEGVVPFFYHQIMNKYLQMQNTVPSIPNSSCIVSSIKTIPKIMGGSLWGKQKHSNFLWSFLFLTWYHLPCVRFNWAPGNGKPYNEVLSSLQPRVLFLPPHQKKTYQPCCCLSRDCTDQGESFAKVLPRVCSSVDSWSLW